MIFVGASPYRKYNGITWTHIASTSCANVNCSLQLGSGWLWATANVEENQFNLRHLQFVIAQCYYIISINHDKYYHTMVAWGNPFSV